jgi:hypothetical protein
MTADGGALLPVRDAWWFIPGQVGQATGRPELGSDDFTSANPAFGAHLTIYLRDLPSTAQEARRTEERALRERNADTPFPGFDRLRAESLERGPQVFVVISDAQGKPVRTLSAPAKSGMHRIAWDLRGPSPFPVDLNPPAFRPPWAGEAQGPLVEPGRYSATLVLASSAGVRTLGAPQSFEVKPVPTVRGTTDFVAVAAFQQRVADLMRRLSATGEELDVIQQALRHARASVTAAPRADATLFARIDSIGVQVAALQRRLSGDPARGRLDESNEISLFGRAYVAMQFAHRQTPTATQQREAALAEAELVAFERDLRALQNGDVAHLQEALAAAGAPWSAGRGVRAP